jgi:hypothetical protein
MTAAELLQSLRLAGFTLDVDGTRLLVAPGRCLTDGQRALIRHHKAGLVALVAPGRGDLAEALAAAIDRACSLRGDTEATRAGLQAECAALPLEAQADMLAHFTVEAARWAAASGMPITKGAT